MDNSSAKLLAEWIVASKGTQFLTAKNTETEMKILDRLQLTEHSTIGCLIKDLGYVVCENRHIRILGGKNPDCESFFDINALYTGSWLLKGVLVIADTSNGGLFALNCDESNGATLGEVLYLPYGSLLWERLDIGYSDFVQWAIHISRKELVEGGWLDDDSELIPLRMRDKITQSKLGILLSMGK